MVIPVIILFDKFIIIDTFKESVTEGLRNISTESDSLNISLFIVAHMVTLS